MKLRFAPLWLFLVACDKPKDAPAPAPSSPTASSSALTAPASAGSDGSLPSPAISAKADPLSALSLGTIVREEKDVVVDGVTEKWRLEWQRPPVPDCVGAAWSTCPCAGFAFGEKGDLDLVRQRPGQPEERLHMDPLFSDNDARIARWPATKADAQKAPEIADIAMRPIVSVMKFADYDHDGRATEFLLQVGAGPCGHTATIVVGVSKSNAKLHAFGAARPGDPALVLDRAQDWEKVRAKQGSGPIDVVQIACGDHGATEQTIVRVTADGDLHGTTETKKCP